MLKRNLPLLCGLLIITTIGYSQLNETNYRIYEVSSGKEVTLDAIVTAMNNYDVVFFGEEHNDSVAHYLEAELFTKLHLTYKEGISLSMEMFDRDVQPIMDEYLMGGIREKNFKKDARVWSNYSNYRPMIEYAKLNSIDVVCANAAGRYSNLAGRLGQAGLIALPKASKAYFAPLPYDTASGLYYEKLVALTNHDPSTNSTDTAVKKAMAPINMGGFNLIMGQSLWDATMAYSIAQYLKQNKHQKILQVNGRFHSDEKFAVVTQLHNYSPKTKTLVISCTSDDAFPTINWQQYSNLGDYIIVTDPAVPKTFDE